MLPFLMRQLSLSSAQARIGLAIQTLMRIYSVTAPGAETRVVAVHKASVLQEAAIPTDVPPEA